MSQVPKAVASCALLAGPSAARQRSSFDFPIANMMRGPDVYGREPQRVRWSADARWIFRLTERAIGPSREPRTTSGAARR